MEAAAWTAIAILAATLLGTIFYLGAKIDALGARLDTRLDSRGARIDQLSARMAEHLERHSSH